VLVRPFLLPTQVVGNRSRLAIELVDDSQHACVGSANPTEQPQPTRYRELVDDSQYARIGSANLRNSNPKLKPRTRLKFARQNERLCFGSKVYLRILRDFKI